MEFKIITSKRISGKLVVLALMQLCRHTVVPANFRIAATARWIAPMRS